MDILRSTIKCLLYDWPIEPVAESVFSKQADYNKSNGQRQYEIKRGKRIKTDDEYISDNFISRLSELMKWRERSFTASEAENIANLLKDEWLEPEEWPKHSYLRPYEKIPLIVNKCASELLNVGSYNPDVKFRHLLRWRDLTLLCDEDTLIATALAAYDAKREEEGIENLFKRNLLWSHPLGHDDIKLNAFLKEELSDTHAHLNASTNVFGVNWLAAMNEPDIFIKEESETLFIHKQDYDPIKSDKSLNLTLEMWGAIAAALRFRLFKLATSKDGEDLDYLNNWGDVSYNADDIKREINSITGEISSLRRDGMKAHDGGVPDYAFTERMARELKPSELHNPEALFYGERNLIYECLLKYFKGDKNALELSSSLYLYLLIKSKIRREFIQTNQLIGFKNFKNYQDRKATFLLNVTSLNFYKTIALKYAVQSSLKTNHQRHFEARIGADSIKTIRATNLNIPIFTKKSWQPDYEFDDTKKLFNIDNLSLVVHFFKSEVKEMKEGKSRLEIARKKLSSDFKKIFKEIKIHRDGIIPITGIDAAGVELQCPPEVFSDVYRKARLAGIRNITYHVGEDFYDIIHGARMIDEAIHFLNLDHGSRLGHALALGVNAKKYYSGRRHYTIIPRQVLLDN